jgi:transposase
MSATLFEAPDASSDVSSRKPIRSGKRFIDIPARDQMSFYPRSVDDYVPQDALVRAVDTIVNQLKFTELEQQYPGGGHPAFPPRFLAKLLFFAYSTGVFSAREISRRLERDLHFMWLAHGLKIDHQTLSDFRTTFYDQLKETFRDTVGMGIAAGLVNLQCVAYDGTKIAAHAQKRVLNKDDLAKAMRKLDEDIEAMLAQAAEIDAAEDEQFGSAQSDELAKKLATAQSRRHKIENAAQVLAQSDSDTVSVNDTEAPVQKVSGVKRPGYNGQAAVDAETNFVLAQDVVLAQNDTHELEPMATQVRENVGQTPQVEVADSGYNSLQTHQAIAGPDRNVYINQKSASDDDRFGHDAFDYDADTDQFTCPANKALVFRSIKTLRDTEYRFYRAQTNCRQCPQRDQCISPKARYRELLIAPHEALLASMRQRVKTDEGKQALQLRKQSVEPTFGLIKSVMGLRQFLLRGLKGARIEFGLCAIAVNLRKLAQWALAGGDVQVLGAAKPLLATHTLQATAA